MSEPQADEGLLILREEYEGDHAYHDGPGRPRMYDNPAQFDEAVDAYYARVMATPGEPLTLTGMCLFMGFSSRKAFDNYASYPEFLHSVDRAKTLIQYGYEKAVITTKNSAAARLLGAMDDYWNPATKVEGVGTGETHEERLAHLR